MAEADMGSHFESLIQMSLQPDEASTSLNQLPFEGLIGDTDHRSTLPPSHRQPIIDDNYVPDQTHQHCCILKNSKELFSI